MCLATNILSNRASFLHQLHMLIAMQLFSCPLSKCHWVMGHVRSNKAEVIQELQAAGFRLVDDKPLLRTNYFLEFVKSGKEEGE